jgi:hypothetical protein
MRDLRKIVAAKMNMKTSKSNVRLFDTAGTEIVADNPSEVLVNGMMLVVASNGKEFLGVRGRTTLSFTPVHTPRYPALMWAQRTGPAVPAQTPPTPPTPPTPTTTTATATNATPPCSLEMSAPGVPLYDGDVLAAFREHVIRHAPDVRVLEVGNGMVCIDYDEGTHKRVRKAGRAGAGFPSAWAAAAASDARGLVLDADTGRVLARRFECFAPKTHRVTDPDSISEKYDGTLVCPVLRGGAGVASTVWMTRREAIALPVHLTGPVVAHPVIQRWLAEGVTPIFEFCRRAFPVSVVTYPEDFLVLLAARHNGTGEYVKVVDDGTPHPWVFARTFEDLDQVPLHGVEGAVVMKHGRRYKVKTLWYKTMLQAIHATRAPDSWKVMGSVMATLGCPRDWIPEHFRMSAEEISIGNPRVQALHRDLQAWAAVMRLRGACAEDLCMVLGREGWDTGVLASVDALLRALHLLLHVGLVAEVRALLSDAGPIVGFQTAFGGTVPEPRGRACEDEDDAHQVVLRLLPAVRDIVVAGGYAAAKLAKVGSGTAVHFLYGYKPSEGKMLGFADAVPGVVDLRVDLQPAGAGPTAPSRHFGTHEYVLLSVQGEVAALGQSTVDFAGVLVPVNTTVTNATVIQALQASFDAGGEPAVVSRLEGRDMGGGGGGGDAREDGGGAEPRTRRRVFCDLDGVLADLKGALGGRALGSVLKDAPRTFWETLPWCRGAKELWTFLETHPSLTPTVLTCLPSTHDCKPRGGRSDVERQKREWVARHLGPHVSVIVCDTMADKVQFATVPGDILLDDNAQVARAWEGAGGVFIHHVHPTHSLLVLQDVCGRGARSDHDDDDDDDDRHCPARPAPEVRVLTGTQADAESRAVFREPSEDATDGCPWVLALDCEWAQGAPVANVCQVASSSERVTVITDPTTSVALRRAMDSPVCTKLVFGLDDLPMLGGCAAVAVPNVVNLQSLFAGRISLDTAVQRVLGPHRALDKSKAHTLFAWDTLDASNPAHGPAIAYAARDAAVLWEVWDALGRPPGVSVRPPTTSNRSAACLSGRDLAPGTRVTRMQGGVLIPGEGCFVVAGAEVAPPVGAPVVFPAGCTLTVASVRDLTDLGEEDTFGGRGGEGEGLPSHSLAHVTRKLVCTYPVHGKGAVLVRVPAAPLASLSSVLQESVAGFVASAGVGDTLCLGRLPGDQRALVHEYATRTGLTSRTSGHEEVSLCRRTKAMRPKPGTSKYDSLFRSAVFCVTDPVLAETLVWEEETEGGPGGGRCGGDDGDLLRDRGLPPVPTMVIMRGLPGSGKSTYVAARARPHVDGVFSADVFLATALQDAEFSKEVADVCHDACFAAAQAFVGGAFKPGWEAAPHTTQLPDVYVDNTNVQWREMARYVHLGVAAGLHIRVVEMECPSLQGAIGLAARAGAHVGPGKARAPGVDAVAAMFSRWEDVRTQLEDAGAGADVVVEPFRNPNPSQSVMRWLTTRGYVRFGGGGGAEASSTATHLCMAVGCTPARSVFVPASAMPEFMEVYLSDAGPKYLMECVDRAQPFRFFMDLDALPAHSTPEALLDTVASLLPAGTGVTVAGVGRGPLEFTRAHVFTDLVVPHAAAARDLARWVAASSGRALDPDMEVYVNGNLRMLGSRKTCKSADLGRVYRVLATNVTDTGHFPSIRV